MIVPLRRGNVKRSGITGQRLAAIFLMGCILLNYPVLSLFTRPAEVAGIPLLYAYLFGAWAVLIGLMALTIERPRD
jgi:type IV secretory pathway VirB3-like protein